MSMPLFKTKRVLKCSTCGTLFDSEDALQAHQAEELAAASLARLRTLLPQEENTVLACISTVLEIASTVKDPHVMKTQVQEQLATLTSLQWCQVEANNLTLLTELIADTAIRITEAPLRNENTVEFTITETLKVSLPSAFLELPRVKALLSTYEQDTHGSSLTVSIYIKVSSDNPSQYLFSSQVQRESYQKSILAQINNRSAANARLSSEIEDLQKFILSLNEEIKALNAIEQTLRNQVKDKKNEQRSIAEQAISAATENCVSTTI